MDDDPRIGAIAASDLSSVAILAAPIGTLGAGDHRGAVAARLGEIFVNLKTLIAAATLVAVLPAGATWAQSSDEEDFKAMVAYLKANDAERQAAIDSCIAAGAGGEMANLAPIMEVPAENSVRTWCLRITNGIADGKLTLADMQGIEQGTLSENIRAVMKTPVEGE